MESWLLSHGSHDQCTIVICGAFYATIKNSTNLLMYFRSCFAFEDSRFDDSVVSGFATRRIDDLVVQCSERINDVRSEVCK